MVSPPAGAKEIAHADVLSASDSPIATAVIRSSGPSWARSRPNLAVSSLTVSRSRSWVVRRSARRYGRGATSEARDPAVKIWPPPLRLAR